MKYNSVDEIDTISFRDAAIVRCVFSAKQGILEFELDGAMVRENNSANELFSDRYVRDMQVRFVNPEVEAILLEGHKYYDANDVLVETVPDRPVDESRYDEVMKCFQMIIDVEEESYVLSFYYDKVIAQWEHFMNKVMN